MDTFFAALQETLTDRGWSADDISSLCDEVSSNLPKADVNKFPYPLPPDPGDPGAPTPA
jgi:hypothetical protein